jgi:hypothetical protein
MHQADGEIYVGQWKNDKVTGGNWGVDLGD